MNNKGFTLIETLLVLLIVAIISSTTFIYLKPQRFFFENQLFLSQLQSDFYMAQQYAIAHQQEVTVLIDINQNRYYIRGKFDGVLLIERTFPPSVSIQPSSLPLNFIFLSDGNVNHFGSLFIYIGEKVYKFTILLGKGRFYIVET